MSADRAPRRWLEIGGIALVTVLNGLLYRTDAEDAYITYRYSLNLAEGHGPVFNAGERVEGYSNFLWMSVLALVHAAAGIRIEQVARALGLLVAVLAVLVTRHLALILTRGNRPVASWCALVVACAGPFAAYAMSGLETPLFVLLVVTLLVLLTQERLILAGLVGALATMTRPDGLVVFSAAALWLVWGDRSARRKVQDLLRAVLPFVIVVVSWTVWRVAYYGYLVPNALAAKTGGVGIGTHVAEGRSYLNGALTESWPWALLVVAALTAALLFGRRWSPSRNDGLVMLQLAVFLGFLVATGGDWMPASRLFAPVLPLVAVMVASVWSRATASVDPAVATRTFGVVAGVSALLLVSVSYTSTNQLPRVRPWNEQVEALAAQGAWLRSSLPRGASIATFANGALSYHAGTDMTVIDMLGLTDEHIARNGARRSPAEAPVGHRAYDDEYVIRRRPDIVIFSGGGYSTIQECSAVPPSTVGTRAPRSRSRSATEPATS
ncbi:MAG: hypothetical protein ACKOA9_00955 [Actinomycetota bacterium]